MKRFRFVLVLMMAFSAAKADEGLWKQIVRAGDASQYPGSHQVTVFDSTSVKVMDSGLSYVTLHRLDKVLTPRGARDLAVLHFNYDPLSADVEVKSVRIFRHDGLIDTVALASILDHAAPARAIYWGAREKMVPVGRLEPGDAVETRVFRKGFTYALLLQEADDDRFIPPMKGHFYDIVPFWSGHPVKVKAYTVCLPQDKPVQYRVYNGEVESWVKFKGERTEYHWVKKEMTPFQREAHMVSPSDVAPKLLLSTSPDWEAKSLWFYGVNEDFGSFDVTPEVQAKTDEIIADCRTDEEKVHALTHWVAEEIRYSGLSMGEGEGYTLHKGEMTFRDRCGVCKDKAGMLVTMLRAAGLKSYPAMTMAGSRIDRIPADQFNHSVTVWKRGEGDYVMLDPTWVPGVRELWSSAEQQQEYLMGVPEGADLRSTPVSPPENHYFRVRGKSRLSADGTLTGSVTVEAEGQSDSRLRGRLRRWLTGRPLVFDQALFDIAPQAEITSLNYNDPYDLTDPFRIEIEYRIPDYAVEADDHLIFVPLVARHLFQNVNPYLTMNLSAESRSYAFRTRCSRWVDFKETVTLPGGYTVSHVPAFVPASGSAADFQASYQTRGRKLIFAQSLKLKKRIYEADEWSNFRQAVTESKKVAQAAVILKKK